MGRVTRRIAWFWQLTRFSTVILIFNTGYLLINMQQWSNNGQWWGWAAIAFWLVLTMFSAYNIGKQRMVTRYAQVIVMQNQMLRLQQEQLEQTFVTPVLSLTVAEPEREGAQPAYLRLGPICPN